MSKLHEWLSIIRSTYVIIQYLPVVFINYTVVQTEVQWNFKSNFWSLYINFLTISERQKLSITSRKRLQKRQRQSWKLALSGKLVGRDLVLRNSQDLFSPRNTTKNILIIVDLDLILNKLQIQTQILLFSEAFCMFNTCLMSTRKTAVLLSVSWDIYLFTCTFYVGKE